MILEKDYVATLTENLCVAAKPATSVLARRPSRRNSILLLQKPNRRKWWILLTYWLFGLANNVCFSTFSGILEPSQSYYNVGENQIIWFGMVFSVNYVLFSFAGSWASEKNLAASLITGTFLNMTGGWIRYFAKRNYGLALFGQFISGFTDIFLGFTPMKQWFPPKERFKAITIGCLSNYFGIGMGFIFSPMLISKNMGVEEILLTVAILMTIPFVLSIFTVRNRSSIPSSLRLLEEEGENFRKVILKLITNRKFMLTALSFALCYAVSMNTIAVLGDYLSGNGFDQLTIGYFGLFYMVFGIISSFFGMVFIERTKVSTHHFDNFIKIFLIIGTVALIPYLALISSDNFILLIFLLCSMGVGLIGYQTFACQSLAEIGFPAPEGVSVNFLYFLGEGFSIILANVTTLEYFGKSGRWFALLYQLPSIIYVVFFYKTSFNKTICEEESLVSNDNKIL